RRDALKQGVTPVYKPLPAERLYLAEQEWKRRLDGSALARLTPFAVPEKNAIEDGARERMSHVLADHKLPNLTQVSDWSTALALPKTSVALVVLGIESGFETD